jgi:hypothetical protein
MHPTGPEQLRSVRRQLAAVADTDDLAPEHRAALVDAGRILERLEASWPARLPFLLADNAATEALLASVGAPVPATGGMERADGADVGGPEEAAHARNKVLRASLAAFVVALPSPPEADDVRRRVAAHLQARLAADPALHRRPRPYGPKPDGAS